MLYRFTPGAQRAIARAAAWRRPADGDETGPVALLAGLLAEPECRAALMLAARGIDLSTVRQRWGDLVPLGEGPDSRAGEDGTVPFAPSDVPEPPPRWASHEVRRSLEAARERLADYPAPLELATEHLLLGLVAAEHEVSTWLRERGLEADRIEAEIHRIYGYRPGPLPAEGINEAGCLPLVAEDVGCMDSEDVGCMDSRTPSKTQSPEGPHPNPLPEGEGRSVPLALPVPSPNPLPEGEGTGRPLLPGEDVAVLRVIDAAANRAREAIRAVEDYVRFVLDDRHLTGRCKRLRHDLTAALGRIAADRRLAARETQADVGTTLSTPSEGRRESTAGVLAANMARFHEALRSLEEFGKLCDAAMAAELKQIRYRAYTLHRAVEITRTSLDRLAAARLYVLVDGGDSPEAFVRLAGSLVEAGVDVLQLRDKRLDDRRLLERARLLREMTREADTLFIVNDRPDLAVLARADGVHVGQDELSVKDARTIVGPEAFVGVSTHTLTQARQAQMDGANYIGVGPTFPSGTKAFDQFPGLDLLRAVAAELRLPAFAIGGIGPENLPEVLSTGIGRVAVAGAVTEADEPAAVARAMLGVLGVGR